MTEKTEAWSEIRKSIHSEIYDIVHKLGAMGDILAIVGSYGDGVPDEETLHHLRIINNRLVTTQRADYTFTEA